MVEIVSENAHDFEKYKKLCGQYGVNKIRGTTFEKYVGHVLGEFFDKTGDRILVQRRFNEIAKDAGYVLSRTWVFLMSSLPTFPLVKQLHKGESPIDYLIQIKNSEKGGPWTDRLRRNAFDVVQIMRLSKYARRPDFIIVTERGNLILVDCKYRSTRYSLTYGDVQRLFVYRKLLQQLFKVNKKYKELGVRELRTPVFLFNIPEPIGTKTDIESGKEKLIKVNLQEMLFLENYIDDDDDPTRVIPSYIVRKEEIKCLLGRKFNIAFIEWFLPAVKRDLKKDTIKIRIDWRRNKYIARSEALDKVIHVGDLNTSRKNKEKQKRMKKEKTKQVSWFAAKTYW